MDDDVFQKLLAWALHLLSIRPRSEAEIRSRLNRIIKNKKYSANLAEPVITRLKELKLIDDSAFVKWWVDSRRHANPKGKRVIRQELILKGVESTIINEVLNNRYQLSEEYEQASQLLLKRISHFRGLSAKELSDKLAQFLLRRGFDRQIIYKVVDDVVKKAYNKNW